jgi:hypothetical protein
VNGLKFGRIFKIAAKETEKWFESGSIEVFAYGLFNGTVSNTGSGRLQGTEWVQLAQVWSTGGFL